MYHCETIQLTENLLLEVEALRAIYGDGAVKWTPVSVYTENYEELKSWGKLRVFAVPHGLSSYLEANGQDEVDEQEHRIKMEFELPMDYPDSPPKCVIDASWIFSPQVLCDVSSNAVKEGFNKGCESLFDIIEHIRDTVPPFQNNTSEDILFEQDKQEDELKDRDIREDQQIPRLSSTVTSEPIQIFSGEPITDTKSVFQAHAAIVHTKEEVYDVLKTLLESPKIARATHNIMAYRLQMQRNGGKKNLAPQEKKGKPTRRNFPEGSSVDSFTIIQDHDSDGETAAGGRLQHLLDILDVTNAVVVVTRWYGGTPLGPRRFRHINNVARQILIDTGIGSR